jgi:hypothetical protein
MACYYNSLSPPAGGSLVPPEQVKNLPGSYGAFTGGIISNASFLMFSSNLLFRQTKIRAPAVFLFIYI